MKIDTLNLTTIHDISQHFDLYICSSSFEERCLSISKHINKSNIAKTIIFTNADLAPYVNHNLNQLKDILSSIPQDTVELSTNNPLLTADNIKEALPHEFTGSILLDITTFTHEALLIILRILKQYHPKAQVTGIYVNATEYSINDKVKYKWLSKGIKEVRSVLGYPGNIIPTKKTHLIVIVGYEHKRAAEIIDAIEPHSISLGYGKSGSSTIEKDKDANKHYKKLVSYMASSYMVVSDFEIPCNDPSETCNILQDQINKFNDMNILIAPMNNKISTVGTAWAAFKNENVQLCYAQALQYNYSGYSNPGKQFYHFKLQ